MSDRSIESLRPRSLPVKLSRLAALVIIALCLVQMPYLIAMSFAETWDELPNLYMYSFTKDNILMNCISTAVGIAIVAALLRVLRKVTLKLLLAVLAALVAVFCLYTVLTVRLAPGLDPGIVAGIARLCAVDDFEAIGNTFIYSGFSFNTYLELFPFQLGFIQYEELLFRLAFALGLPATYACMLMQCVNVLWLLLGYWCMVMSVLRLFKSESAAKLAAVIMALCVPGHMFCVYLYGIVPGFALSALAILMFLRYLETGRPMLALAYAAAMLLAVWMKENFIIIFIAVSIIWFFYILRTPRIKAALLFIAQLVIIIGLVNAPEWNYERRSGVNIDGGTPLIYGITIGIAEDASSPGTTGGGVNFTRFLELEPDEFHEECAEYIRNRVQQLKDDPASAKQYFSAKYRTMWDTPSFDSLWLCLYGGERYSGAGGMYTFLNGSGYSLLTEYMDLLQRLVYIGYAFCLIAMLKRRELKECVFSLSIFGATLFHMIYESPSRSMLHYYIFMCALAGYGYSWVYSHIEDKIRTRRGTI